MRNLLRLGALLVLVLFAATSSVHALEPPLPPKPLGCFKDGTPPELDGYREQSDQTSPMRCGQICQAKGFPFAGVQNGDTCLCGYRYGRYGRADTCTVKCTGESKTCGGKDTIEVFEHARY